MFYTINKENLRKGLFRKGLNLKDLAEETGLHINTISQMLNVQGKKTKASTVYKIAEVLEVEAESLINDF